MEDVGPCDDAVLAEGYCTEGLDDGIAVVCTVDLREEGRGADGAFGCDGFFGEDFTAKGDCGGAGGGEVGG